MKNKFNSFTDNKVKIIPALASDYIVKYQNTYKKNVVNISSESLNQSFYVPLNTFFDSCERLNITIVGNKIQGTYIFDKDRQIHSEEEYFQWQDELEIINASEIKKNDLVPGELCVFEDGSKYFFIGSKFVSILKEYFYREGFDPKKISTISKKHFFIPENFIENNERFFNSGIIYLLSAGGLYPYRQGFKINPSKKIISIDNTKILEEEKINHLIDFYRMDKGNRLAYFEDFNIKNPNYVWSARENKIIHI